MSILNWTSNYPSSIDSFPTLSDNVHSVMASHVNSLAASVIELETIQEEAVLDSDFPSKVGRMIRLGPGSYEVVRDSLTSGVRPYPTDDETVEFQAGSIWIDQYSTAWFCLDPTATSAVWVPASTHVETDSGTSISLAAWDNGRVIRCTSGSTVTATIPTGLPTGFTCEFVQEGAGQVQVVGSGVTLRYPATFNPYTNEQWSSIVVTVLDSDEALVRGDLEAA